MSLEEDERAKVRQRYLYVAYGVAAAGLVVGLWRGWFAETSSGTTEVVPAVILLLVFATFIVRGPAAFQAPATYTARRVIMDVLKAVACWIAMFVWIVVALRLVPDTSAGAAILFGPIIAGIVLSCVYLWRATRFVTGGVTRAFSSVRTFPIDTVDQGSIPVPAADTSSDRLEIPVDFGAVILRFVGSIAALSVTGWVLGRGNVLVSTITTLGLLFVVYVSGRVFIGHGPGLVIDPSGISIRAGLGPIPGVPWSEIDGFALKSNRLYWVLVIGLRDPEKLMAGQSAYRRCSIRQSLQMFGSPVFVSVSMLKCDRTWLLRTATAYRARYGAR